MAAFRVLRSLRNIAPKAIAASIAVTFVLETQALNAACPVKPKAAQAHPVNAVDYRAVADAIRASLDDLEWDDGSWGPVLLRLAWHAAGTYDSQSLTGGSNGATMRFAPEALHGANAGLDKARAKLEQIKQQFPSISYADLWSLAGVLAIAEMGGPVIPWRPGRVDYTNGSHCTPDGRLPDATQGSDHLRCIFGRMGFSDQDIVALSGAHSVGRCHPDRSGFYGPWTFAPTTFSNEYFRLLLEEKWKEVTAPNGKMQYIDESSGSLMMLPSDMALVKDAKLRPYVELYARDKDAFFTDFTAAYQKLSELGVPFSAEVKAVDVTPKSLA